MWRRETTDSNTHSRTIREGCCTSRAGCRSRQRRTFAFSIRLSWRLANSPTVLSLVKTDSGTWLDHTEAPSFWHSRERLAIMRRALTETLIPKYYRYKIYPTILLMLDEGLPKKLPETILNDRGGAFAGNRPNWVKLWESAAADVLDLDHRHLTHLVPLMKHTRKMRRRQPNAFARWDTKARMTLFLLLGERQYPQEELRSWIGMFHNAVVEIGKATSFGKELIDVGRKEGREKGREEGLMSLLGAIRTKWRSRSNKRRK